MKKRVTFLECDNPSCLIGYVVEHYEPLVPGYHFKGGQWTSAGGGPIPAFYACSEECILPAMNHVIKEAS